MHPFLAEAMTDARRRELEAGARRRVPALRPRRLPRRRARVAVGMRLIGWGLRLVDLPADLQLGHEPA
jgi:hypothetical protein